MTGPNYNGILALTAALALVVGPVAGYGALVSGSPGAAQSAANTTTVTTVEPTTTATPTATTTAPTTTTPATNSKDVEVIIEHWDDKVGIAINGGDDVDEVASIRVEGANMTGSMGMDSEYPKAVGTVEAPTTVRVIATFEDGSEQVIAEREIT
jgi:hypothetical protein